jgi:acylphosphatase
MHRKTCHFSGRVQGVGFRYTAQNIAQQYNVKGYVKNLPDGRVELVLEGADEEMDTVVYCIRERLDSFIGKVDSNLLPATGEFGRFQIRH